MMTLEDILTARAALHYWPSKVFVSPRDQADLMDDSIFIHGNAAMWEDSVPRKWACVEGMDWFYDPALTAGTVRFEAPAPAEGESNA